MATPDDTSLSTTDDDIALIRMYAGDNNGAGILMQFNGKHIAVSVFTSEQPGTGQLSPEKHLINLLNQASAEEFEDENEYDDLVDAILDQILDAGRDLFRQVAPIEVASPSAVKNVNLHALLYPGKYHFIFKGDDVGGQPQIIPIHANEAYMVDELPTDVDFADGDDDNSQAQLLARLDSLPRYTTNEIQVIEAIASSGSVSRVRVVSRDAGNPVSADLLCKATDSTGLLSWPMLRRELTCLLTLREHVSRASSDDLTPPVRTPPLVGLVSHPENGCVLGFLRSWVPGERLSDILKREPSATQKQKWATQIRESVNGLHSLGLIWGDGKTSNVIVDCCGSGFDESAEGIGNGGNIWLIDFGGGWTEGWVHREKEDTMEGDEQAVDKILQTLGVTGERPQLA